MITNLISSARARAQRALRNVFCATFASSLFALGRVHRARRRILARNVVTSIYFHNPNKRLFEKCVRWLKSNGYRFLSVLEVIEIVQGRMSPPPGAVWLTFDDGFRRLLDAVVPIARKHHVPITIFIPSGIIEGDGLFPWLAPTRSRLAAGPGHTFPREAMTVTELREIAQYPEISIGSHTVTHAITTGLSSGELRSELAVSKQQLESWIGQPVVSFAYPIGQVDGHEIPLLKESGYLIAVTTEASLLCADVDPFLVPRFHVGDEIPFIEAVCNMVGIWRSAVEPLQHGRLLRWGRKALSGVLPSIHRQKTRGDASLQADRFHQ